MICTREEGVGMGWLVNNSNKKRQRHGSGNGNSDSDSDRVGNGRKYVCMCVWMYVSNIGQNEKDRIG